jgi:hypothetical protein
MKIQALQVLPAQYPGYALFYTLGSVVEVKNGDTVRITVGYSYRGPAKTLTLYGAIGVQAVWFDEKVVNSKQISLPASTSWVTRSDYVDVAIDTSKIAAGTGYDMYAKMKDGSTDLVISPVVYDGITVLADVAEFQNFQISSWAKA